MTQQLICSTEIGQPVSTNEKPAYLLHRQIRQHILIDLGEQAANFLAEPVFERHDNVIDWFTDKGAAIRPFSALSEDEQLQYVGKVDQLLKKLQILANDYIQSGDAAKASLGQAIKDAAQQPAANYRYLIDDQPVVVYWGFRQDAPDYPEFLKRYIEIFEPSTQSESTAQDPKASEQESVQEPAKQDASSKAFDAKDHVTEKNLAAEDSSQTQTDHLSSNPLDQSWWHLLIFAGRVLWGTIALFFLIALILLLLWLLNVWPPNTDYTVPAPSGQGELSLLDGIRRATDEGELLRAELDSLSRELAAEKCNCQPQKSVPPPTPQSKIDEVVNQCDIANLKGNWQSKSDEIFDVQTNVPLTYEYTFNNQGSGQIRINNPSKGITCTGSASARFDEECALRIATTKAGCPGESSFYERTDVVCAFDEGKQVTCKVEQPSYAPFEAQFIWQGE